MHNDGQSVIIRHKEYIGEIKGSIGFTVQGSYTLNPGNKVTFPWLSGIANSFQEYTIRGAVFHYVPSSGTAISSSSSALGTVMIQTTYRSTDSPPSNKQEVLNEYCANEVVPSEPLAHPIECDPKENPFNVQYVRSVSLPSGDSQLIYDLGTTYVCTSGQQGTNVIGDLWLTYEVELRKPLMYSNVTSDYQVMFANTSPASTASIFSNPTYLSATTWPITVAANTITFPVGSVGTWQISIVITPTTTFSSMAMNVAASSVNCQIVNWHPYLSGSNYSFVTLAGTSPTANNCIILSGVTITDPALVATMTFPSFVLAGTISGLSMSVTRLY